MIPNILSISRIVFSLSIILLLPLNNNLLNIICMFLFIFGSFTDYLDGYFARLLDQTSKLGRVLDPISDKVLVCGTLITLISIDTISNIDIFAASLIILREIIVSGLREFYSEIIVSRLAKIKTFIQMISIIFLMPKNLLSPLFIDFGIILLWVAAFLSIYTGIQYFIIGINQKT